MKSSIRKCVIDWLCVPVLRAWYAVFKLGAILCGVLGCSSGMFWCLNRMLDSGKVLLALTMWYVKSMGRQL